MRGVSTDEPSVRAGKYSGGTGQLPYQPGMHSHNRQRRGTVHKAKAARGRFTGVLLTILILVGVGGLGYYGYVVADQNIYQAYGNWAFDQQIAGRAGVTFSDYLRERTPFGFLAGGKEAAAPPVTPPAPALTAGALIGRVEIGRLNISAIVREGVDAATLSTAVGHVPSTSLPGQIGNFAIAAHRDTLFRGLKDIRQGDLVIFQAPQGTYTYKVAATKIVRPTDVSVLRADGGGLIASGDSKTPGKLLTMITCYPFYYVGSAPKRFIVEATLVPPDNPVPAKEPEKAAANPEQKTDDATQTTVQVPVP